MEVWLLSGLLISKVQKKLIEIELLWGVPRKEIMRFLVRATLTNAAGNALCTDKEMGHKMEAILSEVRPESVYFGIEHGQRSLFCIVNVDGSHELPRIAEPFWLGLKADVEFIPVMNQDEFKKASTYIESSTRKFNWK